MRHLGKVLLFSIATSFATAASAIPIIGGDTRVAFTDAITGLEAGLLGNATLVGGTPGLTVNFGITGGDLDESLGGTILHAGSGFSLSNSTNTLSFSNFIIDTNQSLLFGDVALNGGALGNVALFSFDLTGVTVAQLTDLDNPTLALAGTADASAALTSAFGLGDTTGVVFALAATSPVFGQDVIPEPESWALMVLGFGVVGAGLRRRRQVVHLA